MERADHDRSAQAATPATAGALDVQAQAAEPTAASRGQAAGTVGRSWLGRSRLGWSRLRERWLRLADHPVRREAVRLAGFIAAGIAVTWPLATDLIGYLPSSRDSASYVWGFWWMARQVTHLGNPWFTGQMAAPVGVPLGFHTLTPLPGLLMTPVTLCSAPAPPTT